MIINIANLKININLLYEKDFISINDYKIESNSFDASINSIFGNYNIESSELLMETKFYDKYKKDNLIIQHQKRLDGNYYAYII